MYPVMFRPILTFTWTIATAAVLGASPGVRAAPPPGAGLPAQVAALRATVTALQTVVAALQAAAGTVEVWHGSKGSASVEHNTATYVTDWTLSKLVSLELPAGSFFLEAKTSLLEQNEAATFYCTIEDTANGNSAPLDWSWDGATTDEPATLALQTVVTLSLPDTVTFNCGSTGPNSSASQSKLDAIAVGAVH
jgi:hypothetical protein